MAASIDSKPSDDLSALAWVHNELRRSLENAQKALRRYLKESESVARSDLDTADPAALRGARAQLHQGVGALELVGLPAAARVLRSAEAAVQRMMSRPALVNEAAVHTIERVAFALLDYLGRMLAGKPVSAVALFPQYAAAQTLAGSDRIHPADLWEADFLWHDVPAEPGVAPRVADDTARGAMESIVLALMRRPDARQWGRLSDLCAGLGATTPGRSATLWRLAAAFAQGESAGLLTGDLHTKRVAARLLAQLRLSVRQLDEPSERLAQDLLFFCANARLPRDTALELAAPRLAAVRRAWRLPDSAPVEYESERLGRFDPSWIAQARKRVSGAKDVWSAVAGGELHRMAGLVEQFSLLADSLDRLFPKGTRLSKVLLETAQRAVADGSTPAAPLAMEVATSVLYVDATLEDGELDHPELESRVERLAQRIEDVRGGGEPQALEPWMEELYRRVSDRQTMGSVVHELRASLSEVEKQIDQYFRNPSQREVLIPVPNQLSAMRGVLSVLGMDQASQAVLHMRDDVDALASTEVDPQMAIKAGTFDRLADNLGALSFLIDMLSVQPQLAKSLFRFDPEEGSLSAVMGQSERPSAFGGLDELPAAPAPEPALVDEARALAQSVAAQPEAGHIGDLERLTQRAVAEDQHAIAGAASAAQRALQQAADQDAKVAVGAKLAQAVEGLAPPPSLPVELPAAAPLPPPRPASGAGTGLEDDPEMREVFLEEAQEVIGSARTSLDALQEAPDDIGELTTVRRAFHTLKGSSRMVGLRDFGEAAWACEQLYNARLAQSPRMDKALAGLTTEALDYLAAWTDAVAQSHDAGHHSAPVVAAADAMRLRGERVPVAPAGAGEQAAAPTPAVTAPAAPVSQAPERPPATPLPEAVPPFDFPTAELLRERVPDLPSAEDLELATVALRAAPVLEPSSTELAFDLELGGEDVVSTSPAEPVAPAVAPEVIELDFGAFDNLQTTEPAPAPVVPETKATPVALELPDAVPASEEVLDFALDLESAPPSAPAEPPVEPVPPPLLVDEFLEEEHVDFEPTELPEDAFPPPAPVEPPGLVPLPELLVLGEPEAEPLPTIAPLAASAPDAEFLVVPEPEPEPETELEPAPQPATEPSPPGMPEPVVAAVPVVEPSEPAVAAVEEPEGDEQVKVIGPLRIPIPLFNIYLNEADELSRRLSTELAEWAVEHEHRPVQESAIALAHSLAGSSATVGYTDLSTLARALEHALMRSRSIGRSSAGEPELFSDAADEIRRLLHQFAAGFLRPMAPQLLERLDEHERALAEVVAGAAEEPSDRDAGLEEEQARSVFTSAALPGVGGLAATYGALESLPRAPAAVGGARADAFDDDEDIEAVDAIDAELFPIFEEEAEELMPQLQARLREWTMHPSDRSAAASCMRTLHTFKGGARLAGAMRLGEMAHRLETAIEHLAAGEEATVDRIELLLTRADAMLAAFEALRKPVAHPVAAPAAAPPQPVLVELPPVEAMAPEPMPQPATVEAEPPAVAPEPAAAPAAAIDWSRFTGRAIEAPMAGDRPGAGGSAAVRVRSGLLDRLVNHAGEVSITRARIDADVRQLQNSVNDLTDNLDRMRRQLRDIEVQAESQISSRIEAAKAASQAFDPLEMDRFTRFQELTRMMAESVNDVATVQRSVQRTLQSTEDELASQARLTRELQDDLLRTRMVEFESLADRLYRVVRQAAKDSGKQVRLDIVGGAIEVDRGVLERMVGPFEHLLRNSVVHGIEAPDERRTAGKDEMGAVTITVTQEGNEIGVECRDDGAGLDLSRIRQRAEERGLATSAQELSEAALANLIFLPGFTTVSTVTELAGRGVGLDVVRAEVNAMGGRIETASTPGQGTSFRLVLPLTTAVTQVVMLRCADLRVAVPSTLIEIVRRVPTDQVESAYASGSFPVGDQRVPFFWLGGLLQHSVRGPDVGRSQAVVIVRSASQRVALHVDEVLGNQEVVVKHVGPQLARLPGLAGVTLLPSGAVALIYNPVALAALYGDAALQRAQAPVRVRPEVDVDVLAPRAPLVLVVDDSLTVRRVTQRLLAREGYRVALAKDGMDALERLAEERPAVMLSDIEMPRMDGFDLVRNVRADSKLADLPVIMITSRIAQKHRDYAKELGVDHYLGKPFSEEELLSLVARYAGADIPA